MASIIFINLFYKYLLNISSVPGTLLRHWEYSSNLVIHKPCPHNSYLYTLIRKINSAAGAHERGSCFLEEVVPMLRLEKMNNNLSMQSIKGGGKECFKAEGIDER